MRKFHITLAVFSFTAALFLTSSRPADARELVIALDVSTDMAVESLDSGQSALKIAADHARYLVASELIKHPDSTISLVAFAQEAAVLYSGKGDSPDFSAQFDSLELQDVSGSLQTGITASGNLLAQNVSADAERYIVVYTTGGDDTGFDVLRTLEDTALSHAKIRIQLFSEETCEYLPDADLPEDQAITITTYCSNEEAQTTDDTTLFLAVRQQAAAYLGIKEDAIFWESDLIGDLGADTYAAFELLSQLCDNFEVALPPRSDMSVLGEIVLYIAEAKKGGATKGEAAPAGKSYVVDVYYATDRKITGKDDPEFFYGPERSDDGEISYGKCQVSIPESHKIGQIEESWLKLKFMESKDLHIVLEKPAPLERDIFFQELVNRQANGNEFMADDILLFIHGFNQSFAYAAKRSAQIKVDLGFGGTPIMYSWPSNNSLFDYWSDREDVMWSIPHLEKFLAELKAEVPKRKMHLIAHSMGNQALIGALNRLALRQGIDNKKNPLFENIILAAPDFDAQLFAQAVAPEVKNLATNWTIYTSNKDNALLYSENINDVKRLGIPRPSIEGMNVIDATGVEVSPWSVPERHSYYATKLIVIEDMIAVLKGITPGKRNPVSKFLYELRTTVSPMRSKEKPIEYNSNIF